MIKVVLDTNVIISGTFWKGDSFRIIEFIERGELKLILSPSIYEEYSLTMDYEDIVRKVENHEHRKLATQKILKLATIVIPKGKFDLIKDDPDDNKFLEAAIAGRVEFIISQDKHLLTLKEFKGIKILKPEEFLKEYKKLK